MTDARFSTDGGAALIVSGAGPRPDVGRTRRSARARRRRRSPARGKTWKAVAAAARVALGRRRAAAADRGVRAADRRRGRATSAPSRRHPSPLTQLGTLRAALDGAHADASGRRSTRRTIPARARPRSSAATRRGPRPLENAVFFESFYGRNASCNPLAIDRELARRAPGVTRYWSVVDLSVAGPRGRDPRRRRQPGVVARPRLRPAARGQRLAAPHVRAPARARSCCRPGTARR